MWADDGVCCSKHGSPTLPQAEFWRSVPGLIVKGFQFSVLECFGLRSASAAGYTPQTNQKESYGTLGE